jgi:sulfoxide reductase heme-binding subunit YedZ
MSVTYRAINWNRNKIIYDIVMVSLVALYIIIFFVVSYMNESNLADEIILIRALGTVSFLMLNFLLIIGPLARISNIWQPLLYNRRHLGVFTFLLGLLHFIIAIIYYHGYGVLSPIESLWLNITLSPYISYELLGIIPLFIMALMAFLSHDFWLRQLGAPIWKYLHMLVYVAWFALLFHIFLGALQDESAMIFRILLLLNCFVICSLHLYAAFISYRHKKQSYIKDHKATVDWIEIIKPLSIMDGTARLVELEDGRSIAVWHNQGAFYALDNACKHQNGPLSQGKIINNCIVCPWHGYEYQLHNGCSPEPFKEKLATYNLRYDEGRLWLHTKSNGEGIEAQYARITEDC